MKVMLTGSRGFIASHLAVELADHDHEVVGVDHAEGDLTRPDAARMLVAEHRPDVVVHLAAQVGRVFGDDDPEHTIRSNALMTLLVAQACSQYNARMVYTSTSEVYGDQGDAICREDGKLGRCNNLYGLSKRWGEEACRLYATTGLQIIRPSMPYGPGLPAGRGRAAIVNMLWQASTGQPIPVHRGAERSWCWIGDAVRAIRLVIARGEVSYPGQGITHPGWGVYNIGRDDDARSMRYVAEVACSLTGAAHDLIEMIDAPSNQTVVKRLATSKVENLGWAPEVALVDGMRRMLALYERDWAAR